VELDHPPRYLDGPPRILEFVNSRMSLAPLVHVRRTPRLFPLHLTPFEFYMLADDRPEFPMTFVIQMVLNGKLNTARLEASLAEALQRHPLVSAIVRPAKRGIECWVQDPLAQVQIRWQGIDEPLEFDQGEFIDLRNEPGLRIWVQYSDQQTIITTQFHHATCDGIGAYQFLGDWLYGYAVQEGEMLPIRPELPPALLRDRFRNTLDVSKFIDERGKLRIEWDQIRQFESCRGVPLRVPQPASRQSTGQFSEQSDLSIGEPLPFPGVVSATLDRHEFRQLRLEAQAQGLTPNDWCLAQYFYTLRDWNILHSLAAPDLAAPDLAAPDLAAPDLAAPDLAAPDLGNPEEGAGLSVLVPLSLREPGGPALSACNVVTYSVVSREAADLDEQPSFLAGLRQEMSRLKAERHESPFLNMISGARLHTELLEHLLDDGRCLATGTLSNTGDPTKHFLSRLPVERGVLRCGGLQLDSIGGTPPLRPNTNVTVSLFSYRRELRICLRCSSRSFSAAATQALLGQFVDRLRPRCQ
jgi:hypothetical protein